MTKNILAFGGNTYIPEFCPDSSHDVDDLKGLSHEIFGSVYWPVWMHLGLNKHRFWFLNVKEAPLI